MKKFHAFVPSTSSREVRFRVPLVLVLAGAAAWAGCSKDDTDTVSGVDTDQAYTAGDCALSVEVEGGRTMRPEEFAKLDDPVARLVLAQVSVKEPAADAGFDKTVSLGCPRSYEEVAQKLRRADTNACAAPADGAAAPGVVTRFVSERVQATEEPGLSRVVVARTCDGRGAADLFATVYGVTSRDDGTAPERLPNDTQLVGKGTAVVGGATVPVYNFYERSGGKWKYFGNSLGAPLGGYDCLPSGACVPKIRKTATCSGCHVGGGLVMKEIDAPFGNWEGMSPLAGTDAIVARHGASLGTKGDATSLASVVTAANAKIAPSVVAALRTRSVADALRPLFCTMELNLQATGTSPGASNAPSSLRDDFFLDPRLSVGTTFPVVPDDYTKAVRATKQRLVDGRTGGTLQNVRGEELGDTFFTFTYPERSKADASYVDALVASGMVDEDFVLDVLAVDFTRPIFSPERCGLLAAAPTLEPSDQTPAGIRAGFASKLGDTGAAARFKANLANTSDAASHKADVATFVAACKARDKKAFVEDVLAYASHLRRNARELPVIQSTESLVEDDNDRRTTDPLEGRRFDPVTCELK
ncbi:MAG: hypothetical protein U0169_16505 [Polyangiaceae bacterium]